jgi:hypothetical protein
MREVRSYIVRVYRRDARGIAGVVEEVATGCLHSFRTVLDLWTVLAARAAPPSSKRKQK